MKIKLYSHKNGEKVLGNEKDRIIKAVLSKIEVPLRHRSATIVRNEILGGLRFYGWSDEVRIHARRQLTLTGINGRTALCIQTGNMARFYADLLKIQAQFLDTKIDSAVYILPTSEAASKMGENMANFERLTIELKDVFSSVITAPIMVYGFE